MTRPDLPAARRSDHAAGGGQGPLRRCRASVGSGPLAPQRFTLGARVTPWRRLRLVAARLDDLEQFERTADPADEPLDTELQALVDHARRELAIAAGRPEDCQPPPLTDAELAALLADFVAERDAEAAVRAADGRPDWQRLAEDHPSAVVEFVHGRINVHAGGCFHGHPYVAPWPPDRYSTFAEWSAAHGATRGGA